MDNPGDVLLAAGEAGEGFVGMMPVTGQFVFEQLASKKL